MPNTLKSRIEGTSQQGLFFVLNPDDQDFLKYPYSVEDDPAAPALLCIDEDDDLLLELHLKYAKRAIQAYMGRNRNTFILSDRLVVKLPRNADGCTDNDWEGSVSNTPESLNDPDWPQYPRTRLGYFKDIPVVFMERIQPLNTDQIIEKFGVEPDWVASIDCGQVGVNRFGRLVAYDYGIR